MIRKVLLVTSGVVFLGFVYILFSVINQLFYIVPPLGSGDPGNHRLNELAADPIFYSLPPNSKLIGELVKEPAEYKRPGFQGAFWNGPTVTLNFESNSSKVSIYQFIGDRAIQTGWIASDNKNSDGLPYGWLKTYPDGARASLILFGPNDNKYILAGSVSAINR